MAFSRAKFLIEVLGSDGAMALAKAAGRADTIAQMLVPRTLLAWLAAESEFDGQIPGLSDHQLTFQKSEEGFSGSVDIAGAKYNFEGATIFQVAGAVATAMELESLVFGNVRNAELCRLGKSIDLMARVHLAKAAAEESSPDEQCGDCKGKNGGHLLNCKRKLEKGAVNEGGSGTSAAPTAPAPPAAPTATAKQPAMKQVKPKKTTTTVTLTRSEADTACPVCSQKQFRDGDVTFQGCVCFRALAKSVSVMENSDVQVELELGSDWDKASVVTFLESVGRR